MIIEVRTETKVLNENRKTDVKSYFLLTLP